MNTRFTTILVAAAAVALTNVAMAEECPAKEGCPIVAKADGKDAQCKMTAEKKAEMLKKYDKNGDGKIDEAERAVMRSECKVGEGKGAGKGDAKGAGKGKGKGAGA